MLIAGEKLIYKCLMTSFVHTGRTLLKHELSRIKSSFHGRKLPINIAYSSGEIKLWKFQWRHSCTPEVLSKICCSMKYEEFSPLFICANCAYILSIAAEKLNFENFNDVICAYGKYFRKSFWALNMQNLILYSLAPTAHIYCL